MTVYTMCIQCVYNVYATYLHIRGCKQCVCMVVWLLTLNCRVISLWMIDDCDDSDDSDDSVHTIYLQHTYTRECIVIGVVTVVTHSQIYYSAMIFMQCVCWLLIEIILHTPMKLFFARWFTFSFLQKVKVKSFQGWWWSDFTLTFWRNENHFHFEKIFLTVLTELIT